MLEFFYESLETLKEVKKPSKNEVFKMTMAVLVIVAVAWVLFAILDYFFLNLYDGFIFNFLNSIFK